MSYRDPLLGDAVSFVVDGSETDLTSFGAGKAREIVRPNTNDMNKTASMT